MVSYCRDRACPVSTINRSLTKNRDPRYRNQGKNAISSMVGSSKSVITKYNHGNKLQFGWQTPFYDHVIRNSGELYLIRDYIINNPCNWDTDKFYYEWSQAYLKSSTFTLLGESFPATILLEANAIDLMIIVILSISSVSTWSLCLW